MTIVPALLLPCFAWKQRHAARPLFSTAAMAVLAAAYVAPARDDEQLVLPQLPAGSVPVGGPAALRLPSQRCRGRSRLVLAVCALSFSAATGIDYVRLDRDRAEFTAGIDAVPERATLLPLLFKHSKTSDFTASLTHAWGYYTVAKRHVGAAGVRASSAPTRSPTGTFRRAR